MYLREASEAVQHPLHHDLHSVFRVGCANMIVHAQCDFGQWFHMECVNLVELPPRTVKWYCPGDRKKLHKGENSNGLVGRGIK